MFSFFKNKPAGSSIFDKVWISTESKMKALALKSNSPDVIFAAWFDDTIEKAGNALMKAPAIPEIYPIRQLRSQTVANRRLIILEHYPLRKKEDEILNSLTTQGIEVWSALDEPLFTKFGGERIVQLMKQLGMNEEEAIEHKLISNSIRNAQDKIAKEVSMELTARSQEEWMRRNVNFNL